MKTQPCTDSCLISPYFFEKHTNIKSRHGNVFSSRKVLPAELFIDFFQVLTDALLFAKERNK
jgi:hypothetical protein